MPDLSAETIERRLLQRYWLDAWLGPARDQTTLCAAAVEGVDFDPDNAVDTAPFTPAQVRDQVGWVRLSFQEIDTFDDGTTSGLADVAGQERFVSTVKTLTNLQFAIRIPVAGDLELLERFEAKLREIFKGLTINHAGPPAVLLRNLSKYPTRSRAGFDDGPWRVSFVDVKMLRRERTTHVGVQEVALP